jgi:List-Bact-rpt repeat protein
VACTATCASDWDGSEAVILSATPAPGMRFIRWGGSCSGDAPCSVTLTGTVSVSALFAPQTYPLTIGIQGKGGVLTSASAALCRVRCKLSVPSYQPVSLHAVALPGWRFKRWLGSCHGTRATCTLPMTAKSTASAQFVKKPTKKR